MSDAPAKRGRIQFLLIATVFLGPLLLAAWLYYGSDTLRAARADRESERLGSGLIRPAAAPVVALVRGQCCVWRALP